MNKRVRFILTITFILILSFSFAFAGAEWTLKTVTTSTKKHGHNTTVIAKVYTDGVNIREEFVKIEGSGSQGNPYEGSGLYWIYRGKENVVYIVNPQEKSYMVVPIDSMLQLTRAIGKIVKFSIEDYNIKKTVLAPETVNGFKCNHVKLLITYKMKMKIAFIKKTINYEEEKEIWASKDFKYFNNYENAFLDKEFKTGFDELDEAIKEELGTYKNLGFPIKTISTTIERDKKGKIKGKTITTSEVLDVKPRNFDKSFFEIPKDFNNNTQQRRTPF